jgi:DNA mismatch endonuclease (patch repair protein)
MSRVRAKDTKPELAVRRLVHGMGYRYRLHDKRLPGRPDLVFTARRKAIQVHGCFWHRHPDPECHLARLPKSRQEFWIAKLDGNRARDERNAAAVRALGWEQLELWECQLRDRGEVERRVIGFLGERNARH